MKNYKLTIDLLPKGAWGNDLSKTLSKKDWDIIRNECYKKAHYKCEICGYETKELDAYEVWEFNEETRTQTLVNIIAICSKCHGVKHFRNSKRLGFEEDAKKHFMYVNNVSEFEFASHLANALFEFDKRNSVYYWNMDVDLTKLGYKDIKYLQKYRKKIINPYSEIELDSLQNDNSLLPRILELEIDNYNGTINLICDRTNKIEWYGDNLIKTKFNFARNFKTSFDVTELTNSDIYFKLYGNNGEFISKKFKLIDFEM